MSQLNEWMRKFEDLINSPFGLAASYIQSLYPMADAYQLNINDLLEKAGINPERMEQPGYRVPLYRAFKLLKVMEEESLNPHIHIHLGQQVRAKSFQILGYACMSSNNVGEAIDCLIRFEKLVWDIGATHVVHEGDLVKLIWKPKGIPIALVPREVIEMAISGWVNFGYWITGDRHQPLSVHFSHNQPNDLSEYQKVFKTQLKFNEPFNGLTLNTEQLAIPVCEADPGLKLIMDAQGDKLLKKYRSEINIVNEVRSIIYQQELWHNPDMKLVASELNMSQASLKRYLADSGFNFKSVVDDVRRDLALIYFDNTDFSLIDIAFMLGFSEQSAFNRAFKRWTGKSPGRFRQNPPMSMNQ